MSTEVPVHVIERYFLGLEVLHDVLVHVDLFVSVGEFLPNAFEILVFLGRAFASGSTSLEPLFADLFGEFVVLQFEGFDEFTVDECQPFDLPVLFSVLLPTFGGEGSIKVLIVTDNSLHDKIIIGYNREGIDDREEDQ